MVQDNLVDLENSWISLGTIETNALLTAFNVSKFPGIVDEFAGFIKENSFAAQTRHRTQVGFSNDVTIRQFKVTTIRHFLPRNSVQYP